MDVDRLGEMQNDLVSVGGKKFARAFEYPGFHDEVAARGCARYKCACTLGLTAGKIIWTKRCSFNVGHDFVDHALAGVSVDDVGENRSTILLDHVQDIFDVCVARKCLYAHRYPRLQICAEQDTSLNLVKIQPNQLRWWILGGLWLLYASFGAVIVSIAPLVTDIVRDLSLSHSAMGSIMGAWQLVFIFSAIPCGMLLDRIGTGRALLIGGLVIVLSAVGRGLADSYWTFLLAVMLFGVGGPIVSSGAPKLVAELFNGSQRGFAMGIYMTGPSLGGVAALSLTPRVAHAFAGYAVALGHVRVGRRCAGCNTVVVDIGRPHQQSECAEGSPNERYTACHHESLVRATGRACGVVDEHRRFSLQSRAE